MKKPILSKYMKTEMFLMEEEKADEFDQLFETLLMLLKLNRNLTPEIIIEKDGALTLYSRDSTGMSNFSLRLDSVRMSKSDNVFKLGFEVMIISEEVDLSSIEIFDLDCNLDKYTFKSQYDEETIFNVFREIIRCI